MGYTTDFHGDIIIDPPLNEKQRDYINLLCRTRRMKRDVNILMELYKGKHGYPFTKSKDPKKIYGHEGEYFARADGNSGQREDASIIDFNIPPGQVPYDSTKDFNVRWSENEKRIRDGECQPGLWCQWQISEDGAVLYWNGGEKFYNYVEWLKYLTNHFFKKWKKTLNGGITWKGEESTDMGRILVIDNEVKAQVAEVSYKDMDDEE